jgi:2-amino-4-hydroxy-6-hydroxymethyldihydropteridine diphosphokinase
MSKSRLFISLKTFSNQGLDPMRRVLKQLQSDFRVEAISSVYEVSRVAESHAGLRDMKKEERLEGLALVFRASTDLSPEMALSALQKAEQENQREVLRRSVSLNLLLFDGLVVMTSRLSLPHPEMHLRPEEIVLINEIQNDIVHPVLGERLSVLAEPFANKTWGNFFAQGSSVVENLSPLKME